MFSQNFLIASLIWGSVGVGYFIYGKKQAELVPLVGGIVLVGVSYLVSSWILMTLVAVVILAGMRYLMRMGY